MVKIALEWLAGCAGCEISILDLHEGIMELLKEDGWHLVIRN